ncbi:PREDICTED: uncharacterized protein LOC109213773 [Nicotiana attenuata]|uniref:uncharacterized protein LOC109213773 n=1 Tax=Nicotiana attenuata TaxID=49451 RepID=UPI000904C90A|nr:PREDICTED: uncharacterized protein LOC109213773 [Nicotiana attenuata]
MGVNETYMGVRSNLFMMQPSPSLDSAYNILFNDEKQRQVQSNSQFNPNSMSFNVSKQIKPAFGFGFNPNATSNSTPPGPYAPRINFDQNRAPLFCKYCKKSGYLVDKCYKLHGYPQSPKFNKGKKAAAHISTAAHTNSEGNVLESVGTLDEVTNPASNVDGQGSIIPGLSKQQYDQLINLLQQSHMGDAFNSQANLMYSGASNHMTSTIELLFDITLLTIPYLVTLPNGYKVKAPSLKMPLDLGKEEDGLQSFPCSVCPMARQTRLPFPDSSISTTRPFQLIHVDTWGLYHTPTSSGSRIPSRILKNKSPYEILYRQPPNYSHLRTFGCLAYATVPIPQRDELQPRAIPCVFLGYPFAKKGYKLYNLNTMKCFVSRDVIFHETCFPFATSVPSVSSTIPSSSPSSINHQDPIISTPPASPSSHSPPPIPPSPFSPVSPNSIVSSHYKKKPY